MHIGRGQVAPCKAGHDMRGVEKFVAQIIHCIEIICVTGNYVATLCCSYTNSPHPTKVHPTAQNHLVTWCV